MEDLSVNMIFHFVVNDQYNRTPILLPNCLNLSNMKISDVTIETRLLKTNCLETFTKVIIVRLLQFFV